MSKEKAVIPDGIRQVSELITTSISMPIMDADDAESWRFISHLSAAVGRFICYFSIIMLL